MNENRKIIRLEVADFLEIKLLDSEGVRAGGESRNLSPMGICFSSENNWHKGQVLMIDYFMPDQLDSVKLKVFVVWSEFIDDDKGYFCGGEIIEIEAAKKDKFIAYYSFKLDDGSA